MPNQTVTINSRKYDGTIKRSWHADLVMQTGPLLAFIAKFDIDIEHGDLGFIPRGTISHEYYWLDRWYNVFRFLKPDGTLRNYYCNVNMPPIFDGKVLDYVDLDIDILIWPDGEHAILDMHEFEENAAAFGYPDDVHKNALESLAELIDNKEKSRFPFDAPFICVS